MAQRQLRFFFPPLLKILQYTCFRGVSEFRTRMSPQCATLAPVKTTRAALCLFVVRRSHFARPRVGEHKRAECAPFTHVDRHLHEGLLILAKGPPRAVLFTPMWAIPLTPVRHARHSVFPRGPPEHMCASCTHLLHFHINVIAQRAVRVQGRTTASTPGLLCERGV